MKLNTIIQGDSLEVLKTLESESVDCCITSPPYFGLRDYGVKGQIGLEETPELYVSRLVAVFNEIRRVLKPTGTCFLNLGDSYYNYRPGKGSGQTRQSFARNKASVIPRIGRRDNILSGLKEKDLIGIPWRVAFALQADGWYLRQDIIWHKPNPMPESVTDRCTKAHEYVFLLSKSPKYYFDHLVIQDKSIWFETDKRAINGPSSGGKAKSGKYAIDKGGAFQKNGMRNKRSVWTINTKPFAEAHFATFPEALIEPMILAGCPKGGIVLDPFMGAGTTGLVAKKNSRHYLGCELNPEYIKIAETRINGQTPPML